MMLIHTVAAGGGSILHFDGARFTVGPDSAGANPGPGRYRRGGPLTVTDANVMVGKLQPGLLPDDLRAGQDEPLDADARRAPSSRRSPAEIGDGRSRRGGGRRLHPHRGREHGGRRSRRSRCSAAMTSPATRCNVSAGRAASMPASWPTRLA